MLYAQTSKPAANTLKVLMIKKAFPALNIKKIGQINNIVKGNLKPKPWIQMTTKGPSRKQVIILMSSKNNSNFMKNLALYIANINRQLQNTKSEVLVNYIWSDPLGITVITNKVSQQSDLQHINQYIKNSSDINALQVEESCLSQLKSYLKIIGIPFFPHDNSQDCLTSSDVEIILKQNQIFNNITLVSRPRVIKVLPKSDMSIVWIDIWDVQSSSKAKMLINRYFNVEKYIMTIQGANIVKIVDGGLYFIFPFHFILLFFYFYFLFFLFLEQLRLGFISHAVTSVTNWWHSHKTDHRTWENGVEGSGTKWYHTAWTTHAGLMLYSWSFRVGCTVASMDHGE